MKLPEKYLELFGDRVAPDGNLARDNFARWFDGSMLENEGMPLPFYHGTGKGDTISALNQNNDGLVFLAENEYFADWWLDTTQTSRRSVFKVYVRAKKVWDFENPSDVAKLVEEIEKSEESLSENLKQEFKLGSWIHLEYKAPELLQKMGYDAMWIVEEGFRNLAVFPTASIKSAIGNCGLFDPLNNSLTDHVGGSPVTQLFGS